MIFRDWYLLFLLLLLFPLFFPKKTRVLINTVFTGTRSIGLRAYLYKLIYLAWILYLTVLVFFISRPQVPDTSHKSYTQGIDIILCVDISQSMLAEDFKPNRLEAEKQVMQNFIAKRPNDKIGIVVFSGEAYTYVPLSLDHSFLLNKTKELKVNDGSIKQGTAIGVAIATASARLKNSKAKSKVLILLTDGENNTGDIHPLTASDMAQSVGVKIYTIGVGKDGRVPYPVYTNFFGRRVKQYQYMINRLDTKLLNSIATKTGGKFFRATNKDSLKSIFAEIDSLEKEKFLKNQKQTFVDVFPKYSGKVLLLGVILVILSTVIFRRYP